MIHAALVTANNGNLLIKLVLNNSLVGFLDEFNLLHYPVIFLYTLGMIFDGCFNWNPTEHVTM